MIVASLRLSSLRQIQLAMGERTEIFALASSDIHRQGTVGELTVLFALMISDIRRRGFRFFDPRDEALVFTMACTDDA